MFDLTGLNDMINAARYQAATGNQFTLGDLIDALAAAPNQDARVRYDFCYLYPTAFDSYRGYYCDLALGFADADRHGDSPTVKTLLAAAQAADGATFEGWKGGYFPMSRRTFVWVANPGSSGGTAIVGVNADEYEVILNTAKVE